MTEIDPGREIERLAIVIHATGRGQRALAGLAAGHGINWDEALHRVENALLAIRATRRGSEDAVDDDDRAHITAMAPVLLAGFVAGLNAAAHT